ncbi:MAG: LutB/LldF family L-lactate oxidation iron-sulfur protein [Alphaproteobacteria bacterium]
MATPEARTPESFPRNTRRALADPVLQRALTNIPVGFQEKRAAAIARLPEFDALTHRAAAIKDHVLANLDLYLELFEAKVRDQGGHVHWCRDAAEARAAVLSICRQAGAKLVTKGKSMVAEEIALNEHLEAHGITPVETDLGEYIIQLRKEPPSHIIAPAIHLEAPQIADAFLESHRAYGRTKRLETPREMLDEARAILRQKFLGADVGITGANMLVAQTGAAVVVTNEGNADLTMALPPVHIVLASIEKIVPTLDDACTILRVLARSATGQDITAYTTFVSGPKHRNDLDGPDEFHVILLDNTRSAMLGSEFRDMLRCIRCAACMNHCPVYGAVGGHAYGWVYPGPMGAVMTPWLIGIDRAAHLPNASTLCGRCEQVCPMHIPLPRLLRRWREKAWETLTPSRSTWAVRLWAMLAKRPRLYRAATRMATGALARLGRGRGAVRWLPFASGWTEGRDFPAPEGATFHDLWQRRRR